jgi:hypothetical protein
MKTIVRKDIQSKYTNEYEMLNPKVHATPQNPVELRQMLKDASKIYKHKMPAVRIADEKTGAVRDLESTDTLGSNVISLFKLTPYALGERELMYFTHRTVKVAITSQMFSMNLKKEYIRGYNHWSSNIFHFMTEQLPSIMFVIQDIGSSHRNANIPILCLKSTFLGPLFAFFEIKRPVHVLNVMKKLDRIIVCLPKVDVVYEQQYIECGVPSPEKIELVRSFILKKISPEAQNIGILIRRSETTRSIQNHDALLDLLRLKRPDLEWLVFDRQPFGDAVAMFSRTQIIVAPHGAGLTNMFFSPPGTKIVEIMPCDNPNLCYHHLASLLNFDHCIVSCDHLPNLSLVAPLDVIEQMNMETNEYVNK